MYGGVAQQSHHQMVKESRALRRVDDHFVGVQKLEDLFVWIWVLGLIYPISMVNLATSWGYSETNH